MRLTPPPNIGFNWLVERATGYTSPGLDLPAGGAFPGMREALRTTVASGCEIRVLTMDAKNPAFSCMLNPEVAAASAESQERSLNETRSWFKAALGEAPKSGVRALQRGMLFQQIVVADEEALISPYLFSANTGYSPRLDIKKDHPVFDAFLHEFEESWHEAEIDWQRQPRRARSSSSR